MLLAIDVGNSNITLGLYDGETPGPRWRLATVHNRTADEYGLLLDDLLEHAGFDGGRRERGRHGLGRAAADERPRGGRDALSRARAARRRRRREDGRPHPVRRPEAGRRGPRRGRRRDPAPLRRPGVLRGLRHRDDVRRDRPPRATTSGARSRRASASRPTRSSSARRSSRAWTSCARPRSSGRTPCNRFQSGLLFGYVSLVEGMVERFRKELGPSMKTDRDRRPRRDGRERDDVSSTSWLRG